MIYIFGAAFDPPHVGHSAIVRTLLHYKNPEKIILIPSGKRDDKNYHVSDEHRLAMLEMFRDEVSDERVIIDDYFLKNWEGEMITRDVDIYTRGKYGEDIVHVFGTDTIASMPEWDEEGYAAKVIRKLFVPRGYTISESFNYSPKLGDTGVWSGGELEGCVVSERGTHFPCPPNLGGNETIGIVSESSPQGGELEGCVVSERGTHFPFPPNLGGNETIGIVSESSPQGGELEGCVTFVSPKSHIYLKEYASELRKNQTYPELLAWKNIFSKKQLLGYKALRQHTLGPYIVDFYIHVLRLIVEIDGDIHSSQKDKDNERDKFFLIKGYKVIRIPAFEILGNLSGVYEFLREYITHPPSLPNLGRDETTETTHPPSLPNLGRDETTEKRRSHGSPFSREGFPSIANSELFTDSHVPDISSTEVRASIPEHTGLKELFAENPKFIIKGLSNKISRYILEHRLYRPKPSEKPKVLVHVCCGPDVTMPILELRDEYDVICFWYDPNIQPKAEYDKRYEAFVKICELENIPYIKGVYDVGNFFTRIRGVEHTPERGEKCTYCYDMRLSVTARLAHRLGIPYYTSSLNTSPKKDLEKLFKMGHLYAEKYNIEFLDIPFRKRGGFEKSVEYTREHDIYRQNYCGCIYSIREGGESEMKSRMVG